MKLIVFVFIGILALFGGMGIALLQENPVIKKVVVPTPTETPAYHQNPYVLYDLVNNYRSDKGLGKLVFDPSMCAFTETRLSQVHSDWSHNGFTPQVKSAYKFQYAGENLAKGFNTEKETLNSWIHSPEHLENIEKPLYTRTCIATDNEGFIVQEFASF